MTCKDCIHSGLCYKENDYDNFPYRCGDFISNKCLGERPTGRLIDADSLARAIKAECNPYGKPTIDFESGKKVLKIIDNAPTVKDRYGEGYAQGYIDGSTGADMRGDV